MGIFSKVKSFFKKTPSVAQALAVVAVVALPAISHAEGAAGFDASMITTAVDGIGLPVLIGAAVTAMLGVSVLIWGGKKIIGFFSK